MSYLGLIALLITVATAGRWFWRMWHVNIPPTPYLFAALWATGLVLGLVALYQGTGGSAASWAVGLGVVLLYLVATGAQKVDGEVIEVGDPLPAFTALDENGETFDSTLIH